MTQDQILEALEMRQFDYDRYTMEAQEAMDDIMKYSEMLTKLDEDQDND